MIVYVEKDILNNKVAKQIIKKASKIILINHYKDIFNRSHQNFNYQKSQNRLILAVKKDKFLYKGSKFCDNRGFLNFYYSTQILGCIYNCEYCFLGGMYPCGYPVIFVNEEDFLNEAKKLNNSFLAISYETDLLAFEGIYPFCNSWIELAKEKKDILIESRTKSINVDKLPNNPSSNFILTFSLSPKEVIIFEKKTPSLEKRVKAINLALSKGYNVEIAIDPVIKVDNFKEVYKNFINYLKNKLPLKDIKVSIGSFRMNSQFLKRLRKIHLSPIVYYPYEVKNKEARYKDEEEIIKYVKNLLF